MKLLEDVFDKYSGSVKMKKILKVIGSISHVERMEHKKGFYEKYIKRPQDFLCALLV